MSSRRSRVLLGAKAELLLKYRRYFRAHRAGNVVDSDPRMNVVGVGIGPKFRQGRAQARLAVQIYVEHKLVLGTVPVKHRLPSRLAGVGTDVVETGRFIAAGTERCRPAQPGCSIGASTRARSTFGTLAALVQRAGVEEGLYLLGCAHVLSNWGEFPLGTAIIQPSNKDGGSDPGDAIGELFSVYPLRKTRPNRIDAAIAAALPAAVMAEMLPPIELADVIPVRARRGMVVEKVGRTTGHTTGTIMAVDADFHLDSGDPELGGVPMTNQILVRGEGGAFAARGDSGALLVDSESHRATGLLCGVSDSQPIGVASHIEHVLALMNLVLVSAMGASEGHR